MFTSSGSLRKNPSSTGIHPFTMSGDKKTSKRNGPASRSLHILPDKEFKERKSIFTELAEAKHFLTVKHLFYCLLLGLLVKDFITRVVIKTDVDYGLRVLKYAFGKFHFCFILCCMIFCINIFTYYFYNLWAKTRLNLNPKEHFKKLLLDYLFLLLIISYYFYSLYVLPEITKWFQLPLASAAVVVTEQVRLLMKSHAFIRRNASEVITFKPHKDTEFLYPSFSHYIYFLFVPTLVYRHHYPRTKQVDWKIVAQHCSDITVCLWLNSYLMNSFFITKFEYIGIVNYSWSHVLEIILEGIPGGLLLWILSFHLVLHSWMNLFAEMLRFGDRKFYDDWWTATNFQTYFRKSNFVVQDWLYEYVYKDISEVINHRSKVMPKVAVFLISAVVHEYIITACTQCFFPSLFINFFVFGMIFSFVNTKHMCYNILFLYAFSLGVSLNLSLYAMELFAKTNCPNNFGVNTTALRSYVHDFAPKIFSSDCVIGF